MVSETRTTKTEPATEDDTSSAALGWLAEVGAPEWMRRHLSDKRKRSAGHRVRRREAEQRADELLAALRDAERRAQGLPAEALPRITGDDPVSIRADAAFWATALGVTR